MSASALCRDQQSDVDARHGRVSGKPAVPAAATPAAPFTRIRKRGARFDRGESRSDRALVRTAGAGAGRRALNWAKCIPDCFRKRAVSDLLSEAVHALAP